MQRRDFRRKGISVDYLNRERLQNLSSESFQSRQPYPWTEIKSSLTPEGYERLRESLPPIEAGFERQVGIQRAYGQAPHDRYLLHFHPGIQVAEPWLEFLAELQGPVYQSFLRRMLGDHRFIPTFEWYYAWEGCAVSPHCDAARKLATHIFYFNPEDDWDTKWGGQILILDSERKWRTHSGPTFDQLKAAASIDPRGNGSLLFQRTPHSWHGVRPLACPPGRLRRLFIVTVNIPSFQVWWRGVRGKDPDGFRIQAA